MTDLYVGARIEYGSERDVLRRALTVLGRDQRQAVILANLHLGGRQIDLIVAQEELVLVIEAKGASRPIRGGVNGPWQYQAASGDWVDFGGSGNPYEQVRTAKHKVRDALVAMAGSEVPHLGAAVIFVPGIPDGSEAYEGDFSVSVGGLDDVGGLLRRQGESALTLDDWRAFADQHRLRNVSGLESACDPAIFEAEDLIRQYVTAFRRDHAQPGAVVPFACRMDGRDVSSRDVLSLIAEERAEVVIQGPSGCGKTLLATKAVLALTDSGRVPVMIPVKDYAGNLKAVLESEVRVLIDSPATKLLGATRRLNRVPVFVLDGYNECAQADRAALTRKVDALARLYRGSVLVTSQVTLARADRLQLREVQVPPPDMDTKEAIALTWTGGAALPEQSRSLLEAVGSGLEARLVGEVGEEMRPDDSRYVLFDAFARKRLGDSAAEGIRLLSHLAGCLSDRVAFSLPVLEFNRLTDRHGVSQEVASYVQSVGLLAARGNRVSFAHEMYFDAFAAEDVVRRAVDVTAPVLEALASPKHAGRKALILGALANELLRYEVLEGLTDGESVIACFHGECGRGAREWAEAHASALWKALLAEASGVSFCLSEGGLWKAAVEETTLATWSRLERAFTLAMPKLIVEGLYREEALDAIAVLDQRIADEELRLREEAEAHGIPLRSALFANAYAAWEPSAVPGITRVCVLLHSGFYQATCDVVAASLGGRRKTDSLSPGQVYFLLALDRGNVAEAPFLIAAIESHWARAAYHLKLDLLWAAGMCQIRDENARAALVATISGLPQPGNAIIASSIGETLQMLGAFEDSEREHVAVVRQELRQCLADPEQADRRLEAYGLYAKQLDFHPYRGAYREAISELSEGDRKILLVMAAKGAPDTIGFLLPLLVELAAFGDPDTGDCFSQWTALPPADSVMRQDAIAVFAVAHVALGRLGCPLSDQTVGDGYSAEALAACGAILYWLNRHDLDWMTRRRSCEAPLRLLLQHDHGAALDVIRFCEYELRSGGLVEGLKGPDVATPPELSIVSAFPAEAVEVCRHALTDPSSQIGYFGSGSSYDDRQNLPFAMDVLACHGINTDLDLDLLRGYRDDAALGTRAIAAVEALEERLHG